MIIKHQRKNIFKNRPPKGFTLIELLVVMAIMGILAVISLANFQTAQSKSRDAQRKTDLRQIALALEAYQNDHGGYPVSRTAPLDPATNTGKIKSCGGCDTTPALLGCEWSGTDNREFCDSQKTVYMRMVPGDASGNPNYCYDSDGVYFKVFARLENTKDPDCISKNASNDCLANVMCLGNGYNFGISSGNTTPLPTPAP